MDKRAITFFIFSVLVWKDTIKRILKCRWHYGMFIILVYSHELTGQRVSTGLRFFPTTWFHKCSFYCRQQMSIPHHDSPRLSCHLCSFYNWYLLNCHPYQQSRPADLTWPPAEYHMRHLLLLKPVSCYRAEFASSLHGLWYHLIARWRILFQAIFWSHLSCNRFR